MGRFGADFGSIWDRFGSIWDRFGVGLGSIWGPFGVDLGSIWGRFGVDLGSVCQNLRKFGQIRKTFVREGLVRKGGPMYGSHGIEHRLSSGLIGETER